MLVLMAIVAISFGEEEVSEDDGGKQERQCEDFPFWMLLQNSGNPMNSGPSLWILMAVGIGAISIARNLTFEGQ